MDADLLQNSTLSPASAASDLLTAVPRAPNLQLVPIGCPFQRAGPGALDSHHNTPSPSSILSWCQHSVECGCDREAHSIPTP